ncbi:HEPN/Toprim-associated domain-containing protein [Bradyrhizobium sp. 2S1]|uniref:HEPN/Toprim-associated domain-containing protein n=1 Tax=Bradyrhizobium sp. 2S1 TaxID=1404429 RepID=UPI0014088BF1|nr:HEPN/Toprim-associated domain-containing protein [Bradyrhizobium sp. 2S1]MCK7664530.1 HEPN/Toprim-associated domain-containing protein [Bradyrhizobium sp. 2S1]
MGSMISLAVGRLEIDWGKNNGFVDHSALFQTSDIAAVPYYYAGDEIEGRNGEPAWEVITEMKDGLSKPLAQVIDRINLLGHTRVVCEKEFAALAEFSGFDAASFTFDDLREALSTLDVTALSPNYGEGGEDFGKFFRREILPRLNLKQGGPDPMGLSGIAQGMENLTSYTILHLLADNPAAQTLNVQWAFNDVEDGGWANRDDFVRPLDQRHRFLLVTEGSSDAAILRKAFALLKPHIADFFDFVDMEEGYPFSGTGNVFRFIQGLISIRVMNSVVVIYDNDAEGRANYERTLGLNIPDNLAVLKLPDRPEFVRFPTQGPNGEGEADINGRAVAIECFLDLPGDARVRWSSYVSKVDAYQGELIDKERYAREFIKQRGRAKGYDYSKIEAVLDYIISRAIVMREPGVIEEFERLGISE